ncbi:uncharacterized protein LOC111404064 [Olea europaea var. sylvestris]|uniref:uncharacterized protein LOC111404064 n=1 Tax=Olea europaea var. sylvestris TaxID=158386 RepID=UPI000C1D30EF|nr:uncharacterized protein LOC111404064 [Olea europaea var. sylvestris]
MFSHQREEGSGKGRENGEGSSYINSRGSAGGGFTAPKITKLDFPSYNGMDDPIGWNCRMEQFYDFHQTEEADKLPLAGYHLDGDVQLWYQSFKARREGVNWEVFKYELHLRYGPSRYHNFFGDLTKLKQTGSVRDYQMEFDRLLHRVGSLSKGQQVGCFISGLKESLRVDVQACNPVSLSATIGLAHLYESRLIDQCRSGLSEFRKAPTTPGPSPIPSASLTRAHNPVIKRLSPTELQDRRSRGLYFNCDEKFSPGHRCKKLFFIEGIFPSSEESEDEVIAEEELETNIPEISFHAISGTSNPRTIRLLGKIGGIPITILIDSGSTHNFLNSKVASKVGIKATKPGAFLVQVANGNKMKSEGLCKSTCFTVQKIDFQVDVFLLPVEEFWAAVKEGKSCFFAPIKLPESWRKASELAGHIKSRIAGHFESLVGYFHGDSMTATSTYPRLQNPLEQGTNPISVRPYRYPHYQKNETEKIVQELLSTGVVRLSTSPYSSPVLLVKKHDGSWRLCVDYRALNNITIKDRYPIPIIDKLLDELHGAQFFTKLDLRSGYHQIRMYSGDIKKTAFRTHEGHYEFLVMPFGLTNAPATFQSVMNEVFKDFLRKFVLVFFDDILIFSKSWDEHLIHVERVFHTLRAKKNFVKREKCQFGQKEVVYLGHIISIQGVAMDPEKISSINSWPKPTTLKALRGFLGLTGYYRKFIHNYRMIAQPLTELLKNDSFKWNEAGNGAFEKLKQAMATGPVLALPDFSQQFIVEYDVSGIGLEAVLMQQGRPIAFFSQALHGKNLALSTYEKEMLALVKAVQKWRPYLLGTKFTVRTDQKSLQYLLGQTITTVAQQKWLVKLLGFDFEIHYKKGKENSAPDH